LNNTDLVATLSFTVKKDKILLYESNLIDSIKERSTNRRHYEKELSEDFIKEIETVAESTDLRLKFFYDSKDKRFDCEKISLSEEVILKTKNYTSYFSKMLFGPKSKN